jgi:hypothetical protein
MSRMTARTATTPRAVHERPAGAEAAAPARLASEPEGARAGTFNPASVLRLRMLC